MIDEVLERGGRCMSFSIFSLSLSLPLFLFLSLSFSLSLSLLFPSFSPPSGYSTMNAEYLSHTSGFGTSTPTSLSA